jgi:hypothetical protein
MASEDRVAGQGAPTGDPVPPSGSERERVVLSNKQ